jgi:hypothetical protein
MSSTKAVPSHRLRLFRRCAPGSRTVKLRLTETAGAVSIRTLERPWSSLGGGWLGCLRVQSRPRGRSFTVVPAAPERCQALERLSSRAG